MKHLIVAILMAGAVLVPTESVAQNRPACMPRETFVKNALTGLLRLTPPGVYSSSLISKGRVLVEEWTTEGRWVVTTTDAQDRTCIFGHGTRA